MTCLCHLRRDEATRRSEEEPDNLQHAELWHTKRQKAFVNGPATSRLHGCERAEVRNAGADTAGDVDQDTNDDRPQLQSAHC
jgi:hypothetical protein